MPHLSKSLPKYCKHRASGQAVVTLCARDFYLGPHGTKASKLQYDRLVCEWLANGRRLTEEHPERPLAVVELIKAYWSHCQHYYVKNGRQTVSFRQGCKKFPWPGLQGRIRIRCPSVIG